MATEPQDLNEQAEPAAETKSSRGRRFVRLFLMAAGGLAAPCLALAAFFLSNSGGADSPAAKSAAVQGGRATTATTAKPKATPPTTTTSTTRPAGPVGPPPRDPFVPLVNPGAGGTPGK